MHSCCSAPEAVLVWWVPHCGWRLRSKKLTRRDQSTATSHGTPSSCPASISRTAPFPLPVPTAQACARATTVWSWVCGTSLVMAAPKLAPPPNMGVAGCLIGHRPCSLAALLDVSRIAHDTRFAGHRPCSVCHGAVLPHRTCSPSIGYPSVSTPW